jgi:hypothetical protein
MNASEEPITVAANVRWRADTGRGYERDFCYAVVAVIVSLHVATGAAAGALADSRLAALALGPALHFAGDVMPHEDIPSTTFELVSGVGALLMLAARRGPVSPATIGAVSASWFDLEHVLRLPRPGGRKLFPSHRNENWHNRGGVPAWLQVAAAGAIIAVLLARR